MKDNIGKCLHKSTESTLNGVKSFLLIAAGSVDTLLSLTPNPSLGYFKTAERWSLRRHEGRIRNDGDQTSPNNEFFKLETLRRGRNSLVDINGVTGYREVTTWAIRKLE